MYADTLQALSWRPRSGRSTTTTSIALTTLKPDFLANRANGIGEEQSLHFAIAKHIPEYGKASETAYKVSGRKIIVSWVVR